VRLISLAQLLCFPIFFCLAKKAPSVLRSKPFLEVGWHNSAGNGVKLVRRRNTASQKKLPFSKSKNPRGESFPKLFEPFVPFESQYLHAV